MQHQQEIPWYQTSFSIISRPPQTSYWCGTLISPHWHHHSQDQLSEFHTGHYKTLGCDVLYQAHSTCFYKTISSEFLVQGNFKHSHFSQAFIWYWRVSNSQPLAPKASAVSIELTWLHNLQHQRWDSHPSS